MNMVRGLPHAKYSVLGNTFHIVDGTDLVSGENQLAGLARRLLDDHHGLGAADNLLVVTVDGLAQEQDVASQATFRIFEQDGSETLSCGNGLLAVGEWLFARHGRRDWDVRTELPTGRPVTVRVTASSDGCGDVRLQVPPARAILPELMRRESISLLPVLVGSGIERLGALLVHLPDELAAAAGMPVEVSLEGHTVFTGEPHLVVEARSIKGLSELVMSNNSLERQSLGDHVLDELGRSLTTAHRGTFPAGVHLDLVERVGDAVIRIRTWERAIWCETDACGTGAIAAAEVLWATDPTAPRRVRILPCRAGRSGPTGSYVVELRDDGGRHLQAKATAVSAGVVTSAWVIEGSEHRDSEMQSEHMEMS